MSQRSPYADLKSLTDEALVAAVLASQPGAWAAFFARFERLINSCIRRVLLRYGAFHGQEDIEDLVSTTALNLVKDDYKKLRAFDATRSSAGDLTVTTDYATAYKLFVEQDQAAGMQAFMAGKVKVQGDMMKMMAMQTSMPQDEIAKTIAKEIKDITA